MFLSDRSLAQRGHFAARGLFSRDLEGLLVGETRSQAILCPPYGYYA